MSPGKRADLETELCSQDKLMDGHLRLKGKIL